MIVHANLDCEARWAGMQLPRAVEQRISLLGTLVAALAPDPTACEVWTPAPVDPARLVGFAVGALRTGTPTRPSLAWAQPTAKGANDRRFALQVAALHGVALPAARVVTSLAELDAHATGAWIAKAPWTAAGRDRYRGDGPLVGEGRARVTRLLARFGALVVEPWCERVLDVGLCATVDRAGVVVAKTPHGLVVDARGGFLGIDRAPPALLPAERATLDDIAGLAGVALAAIGYSGPFAIDGFAYRDRDGARRFHPLCEINARYSFGWIAHALACGRLGLAGPPPPGARVLIAPTADDPTTAWVTSPAGA